MHNLSMLSNDFLFIKYIPGEAQLVAVLIFSQYKNKSFLLSVELKLYI